MKEINIPPLYLFTSIALMLVLHFYFPIYKIFEFPVSLVGLIILIFGISMIVWKARYFNKYDTPIKPFEKSTYLIRDGLYRYSRNPIYLGMVILLLGGAILLGSVSPFFVVPVFAFVTQKVFILKEEKDLEEIFGKEYLDYKSEVRRWI